MRSVYIETTIPSFYFDERQTPEALAWRNATRLWWSKYRQEYRLVTSPFVIDELDAAPDTDARGGAMNPPTEPHHPRQPQDGDPAQSLWSDAAVEEIRAIRRQLWNASGRDVHRFIERARQQEHRRAAERTHDQ